MDERDLNNKDIDVIEKEQGPKKNKKLLPLLSSIGFGCLSVASAAVSILTLNSVPLISAATLPMCAVAALEARSDVIELIRGEDARPRPRGAYITDAKKFLLEKKIGLRSRDSDVNKTQSETKSEDIDESKNKNQAEKKGVNPGIEKNNNEEMDVSQNVIGVKPRSFVESIKENKSLNANKLYRS